MIVTSIVGGCSRAGVGCEARDVTGAVNKGWMRWRHVHCGDVFAGEGIRRVGNEQTCLEAWMSALDCRPCRLTSLTDLADSTIACHDALQLMNCMVSPTCTSPSGGRGRGDDSHLPSFVRAVGAGAQTFRD